MKTVDGRAFECKKCGQCCRWKGVVRVTGKDLDRLAEHNKIDKDEAEEKYTETHKGMRVLKNKPDSTDCVFLKDNQCSIFEIKPKQCDLFPWEYDKRCPGFEKGNNDRSASMNYAEVVKRVREKLGDSDDYLKSVSEGLYKDLEKGLKTARLASQAINEGIDAYLSNNVVKVASLEDIFAFDRIDKAALIHRSSKDLWTISSDENGGVQIIRQFDDNGEPLKG
jgi:Fe-S-cluster containining protein